jgi:hypothetical protein
VPVKVWNGIFTIINNNKPPDEVILFIYDAGNLQLKNFKFMGDH